MFLSRVEGVRALSSFDVGGPGGIHDMINWASNRPTKPTTMANLVLPLLLFLSALASAATDTPFLGYPSPWATNITDPAWAAAYAQAIAFVANLTLTEKVNLTTGTGWEADRCIGTTGGIPRLGFRPFCLMDGPLGVRYSVFRSPAVLA